MALILIEPFSRYASSASSAEAGTSNDDLTTVWTSDNMGFDNTQGRFGARVLNVQQSARLLRMRLGTVSGTTLIIAGAIKWDSSLSSHPSSADLVYVSTATGSTKHWAIQLGTGGTLYVFAAGGTTLVGTIPNALMSGVWHYLEVKVAQDNSGTLTVRIDGVQVFTVTATDFQNGSAVFESAWLTGNHNNVYWEDVIVMDGSGATFNDFMGDMRFEVQIPDADGATANWTPLASTNVSNIDDPLGTNDADTTYISSATTNQDNYASHANIAATSATTIHFASLFVLARADAAGDKINVQVDSGGTVDRSADLDLVNGTYRWRKKVWELDPNTAADWTVANINAAVWGVRKRV